MNGIKTMLATSLAVFDCVIPITLIQFTVYTHDETPRFART